MTTRDELKRDHDLTALFIAKQLGPRPRRVVDQEAAIERASDVLDSLESQEAAHARRILAIEMLAITNANDHIRRNRPTRNDFQAAIAAIDGADDPRRASARPRRDGHPCRSGRLGPLG